METRKPTHNPAHMSDAAFPDEAEQRSLRTSWRGVTRRAILLATCAATASTLMFPSASFAAEWVNVDGTQYDQAAGDEAGTWSWDGADSMNLNGYEGSGISAAGKLEITYTGENNVTASEQESGIYVENGEEEAADLTITGDEDSSLTVETENADAIYSDGDITVNGGGTVNATSEMWDGINAVGDLEINGSNVNASGCDEPLFSEGTTTIVNSEVKAEGTFSGIYSYGGLIIDNSEVKASAIDESRESYQSIGIFTDEGDITIKNNSLVEATAKNSGAAYGIRTYNYSIESGGGHITIADSTVTAKAETSNPGKYRAFGILAETNESPAPASIDITRSNITAEGTDAAILSRNIDLASKDPEFGTITIKDSTIVTPQGGKLAKYEYSYGEVDDRSGDEEESDYILERGMTIVSADANTDEVITDESLLDVIAKKAVIEADKEPEPTPEIKPAGYVTPTGATGEKKAIPQTGDASATGLIASAIAGASALATGLFMARKRES